jgi:hypothetical protein
MSLAIARATVLLPFRHQSKQVKLYVICSYLKKDFLNKIYFFFIKCLSYVMFFQMSEMHGKVIGQKPLFVAVAERKEERKARLQVMLVFYLVYISFKLTLELNYG